MNNPTERAMVMLPPGASRELAPAVPAEMTIEGLVAQVQKIQQAIRAVFVENEHYGAIPGASPRKGLDGKPLPPKNVLLKAGAEKLCLLFRLAVDYAIVNRVDEPGFIYREVKATLTHIPTGNVHGAGIGSCSSREEKYGWRKGARLCPACGREAIIKGKEEYGGGWLCFKRKDGCGAKFGDGDPAIEEQKTDRVPAENIWDQENTISKMAQKRALIAAVLNATAASDLFTQDLEDTAAAAAPPPRPAAPAPRSAVRSPPAAPPPRPAAPAPRSAVRSPPAAPPVAHDPETGEVQPRPSLRAQHVKIFAKANEVGYKTKESVYVVVEAEIGRKLTVGGGETSIKALTWDEAEHVYAMLAQMVPAGAEAAR